MTKYAVREKNTKRVTRVLAQALGCSDGEERRCGEWGFHIGNIWAKTRKELHARP